MENLSRAVSTRTSICVSQLPEIHHGLEGIERLIEKQSKGGNSKEIQVLVRCLMGCHQAVMG